MAAFLRYPRQGKWQKTGAARLSRSYSRACLNTDTSSIYMSESPLCEKSPCSDKGYEDFKGLFQSVEDIYRRAEK
jgi:hypothetical protein